MDVPVPESLHDVLVTQSTPFPAYNVSLSGADDPTLWAWGLVVPCMCRISEVSVKDMSKTILGTYM